MNALFSKFAGVALVALSVVASQPTECHAKTRDFTNHPAAKRLAEEIRSKYCRGNERSASVEKFTVDTKSGEVHLKINCRHYHRIKTPFGKKTVYSVSQSATVHVNIKEGKVKGHVVLGRVAGQEIRVSLAELARLIAGVV